MKEGIHPKYVDTTITCACGEVIHTRSTKENIRVEICSKCHPFFTGASLQKAGRLSEGIACLCTVPTAEKICGQGFVR